MKTHRILAEGASRSFPEPHPFLSAAAADGGGLAIIGRDAGRAFDSLNDHDRFDFIAIELGTECLGVHTAEPIAAPASNVVGFARFRLGDAPPSNLVELVKQANTRPQAVESARRAFAAAGLNTAVCNDFPGRIVDRLIRPFYNALLRRFDEGLASAGDLDKTLCLGLGYPEGPLELLYRTGLEHHFDVCSSLFEALGQEPYAPARRARVAAAVMRPRRSSRSFPEIQR
jgi:3-hydroxybutyryl-CoA dehydrogenase